MANCLVLGANGFIGSHLVDELVSKGHYVRAFDRFPDEDYNFQENSSVEIFAGDFLNRTDLANACKDMDFVFHLISITTPISSEDDPLIDVETNIPMSIQLFQECVEKSVKKVIFVSTGGAIYGENSGELVSEATMPQPISPYAIGKLTIEHYLGYFAHKYGLSSLVYRVSNPYGERQSLNAKQGVIPIFLQRLVRGEPLVIFGDGTMVRDYIYVRDVARMMAESFESASKSLYNLGSGKGISINELVDAIKQVTGREFQVEHRPAPSTFVDKIVLDNTRFKMEFNIQESFDLATGIETTLHYIESKLKVK